MYTYEKVKKWFTDRKEQLVYSLCFVIVFLLGFGAGKALPETKNNQVNYSKPAIKKPEKPNDKPSPPTSAINKFQTSSAVTSTAGKGECVIKGNVSASGKIYHEKGGVSYAKTNPEQCFSTQAEAEAAGFRKAIR